MKILIVGSGAREHSICWACARSKLRPVITCTPGNGGTASIARNIEIQAEDVVQLEEYVRASRFDLIIIGPEAPAVGGLADRLLSRGFRVFGPTAGAAAIEGSKAYAKRLMAREGIPTAEFEIFNDKEKADDYIRSKGVPIVVKVSGLAAGKGAIVCKSLEEATAATKLIFEDRVFGGAGDEIVIEAFSNGSEVSMMALVDGTDYLLLPSSRDHKQIFDGDKGPNTGGMGAISPVPELPQERFAKFAGQILPALLRGLEKDGRRFQGAIYPGLMVNGNQFELLEVNARLGDPEAQVLLPMLNFDFLEAAAELAEGSFGVWIKRQGFDPLAPSGYTRAGVAATVVAASKGYPGAYRKGMPIAQIPEESDTLIPFHAGTKKIGQNLITSGGRVMSITGLGLTLDEALETAYEGIGRLKFEGMYYRRDIGRAGKR